MFLQYILYGDLGEQYYFLVKIGVTLFFSQKNLPPLIINWSLPKYIKLLQPSPHVED